MLGARKTQQAKNINGRIQPKPKVSSAAKPFNISGPTEAFNAAVTDESGWAMRIPKVFTHHLHGFFSLPEWRMANSAGKKQERNRRGLAGRKIESRGCQRKKNKIGVINDPFGQSYSQNDIILIEQVLCLARFWIVGGQATCGKIIITTYYDLGWTEWINIGDEKNFKLLHSFLNLMRSENPI